MIIPAWDLDSSLVVAEIEKSDTTCFTISTSLKKSVSKTFQRIRIEIASLGVLITEINIDQYPTLSKKFTRYELRWFMIRGVVRYSNILVSIK